MAAGLDPGARRLDADQLDALIGEERREDPDRVRAAADARDHPRRQPPDPLEELRARLVADRALQLAHDRRVRRRTHGAADDVVRRGDVLDPVADRRRGRLLERARPGADRRHARAQQLHPLDVGLLAADVLLAHVDDALQAEQRARGGRRDAVLAGAGLGDDPRLAHPLRQQRLPERVVELVRAGVVEILALEPDRAPRALAQPTRLIQRRRTPGEVAQQQRQLRAEVRRSPRLEPRLLQLAQRRHQRLRHVLAAIGAVAMRDRAHTATAAVASKNARIRSGSLTPGSDSTPLATSTANGWVVAIAAVT